MEEELERVEEKNKGITRNQRTRKLNNQTLIDNQENNRTAQHPGSLVFRTDNLPSAVPSSVKV